MLYDKTVSEILFGQKFTKRDFRLPLASLEKQLSAFQLKILSLFKGFHIGGD